MRVGRMPSLLPHQLQTPNARCSNQDAILPIRPVLVMEINVDANLVKEKITVAFFLNHNRHIDTLPFDYLTFTYQEVCGTIHLQLFFDRL